MKVLLIVIDGAAPRVFCPAVKTGRLRTMQRLAEAGCMHEASVSIFPSITPAATSSIITGCYPSEHGIEGAGRATPPCSISLWTLRSIDIALLCMKLLGLPMRDTIGDPRPGR